MRNTPTTTPTPANATVGHAVECALAAIAFALELGSETHSDPCHSGRKRQKGEWKGRLANNVIELGSSHPSHSLAAMSAQLRQPETGRWEVDDSVVRQAALLRVEGDGFWQQFVRNLRLPHPLLWLEFRPGNGLGLEFARSERVGCLISQEVVGELEFRVLVRDDGNVYESFLVSRLGALGPSVIADTPRDTRLRRPSMDHFDRPIAEKVCTDMALDIVRLLAIMTAYRTPVSVGEAEDLTALNRQREKAGRCRRWALQPVRWTVSYRPDRGRATDHLNDAAEPAYHKRRHYQRGHFKERNGLVFWVSGHFHGRGEDMPTDGRDHRVGSAHLRAAKKQ